ncbi:MAG TPA: nucleotidyltransferase domain-containing protein [Vicinamibacterales bacterium]|nr:nucleotidyltransferase domain-containing protein [Vicinamibacterales bacterium]
MAERGQQPGVIVETLRHALGDGIAVYQFGSSVGGSTHRGSDVDVAVLADRPLAATDRFDLQERVAGRLGRDVDLLDLRSASTVMAMQVITTGELLFDGDPVSRGAFEDRAFSSYARLNEERRGILERIAAEGTIYG